MIAVNTPLVDAIAQRVVELLEPRLTAPAQPALVDAATIAQALGVTRETVYQHADDLGARRIGTGPRGRLRFNLAEALERWAADEPASEPAVERPSRARQRAMSATAPLLPIRAAK